MAAGIYLDLHFDKDFIGCVTGGAWVVPVSLSRNQAGVTHLSHDCCTMGELEYVLKQIENDIAGIRKKAAVKFAQNQKSRI